MDSFIDLTATFNGDGTAANQAASNGAPGAYNSLNLANHSSGDTVWIRRAGSQSISGTVNFNFPLALIGWPNVGDIEYVSRPATGTANGWDSDVGLATFGFTAAADQWLVTSVGCEFKRITISNTDGGAGAAAFVEIQTDPVFEGCIISAVVSNGNARDCIYCAPNSTPTLLSTSASTTEDGRAIYCNDANIYASLCTFRKLNPLNITYPVADVFDCEHAYFEECLFRVAGGTDSPAALWVHNTTGVASQPTFIQCSIENNLGGTNSFDACFKLDSLAIISNCTVTGTEIYVPVLTDNPYLPGDKPIHFGAYNQTRDRTYGISLSSPCCVYAANANFGATNSSADIRARIGDMVMLPNVLFNNMYMANETDLDILGVPGIFLLQDQQWLKSSNTVGVLTGSEQRTATRSLATRRQDASGDPDDRLQYLYDACHPDNPALLIRLKSGARTVTLWIKSTQFSVLNSSKHHWFTVEHNDVIDSTLGTAWTLSSGWYSITKSISVASDCLALINLHGMTHEVTLDLKVDVT